TEELVPLEEIDLMARRPIGRESRRQVAAHRAPPRTDVVFTDGLAVFLTEEDFKKAQGRRVVKHLRIDAATAAPGRRDYHRHAVSEADGATPRILLGNPKTELLFQRNPLDCRVYPGRTFPRMGFGGMGRHERRDMVEIPVVLVIGEDEYRPLPDLRVLRKDIQHLRNIPGTVPWSGRMV